MAASSGMDALYVSVYEPSESINDSRMHDWDATADLIDLAHRRGIDVLALYGDPAWPEADMRCNAHRQPPRSFSPLELMNWVAKYNESRPDYRFDGVTLDVESASGFDETLEGNKYWLEGLLALYKCTLETLPADLKLAVTIKDSCDSVDVAFEGSVKPTRQHIIDLANKGLETVIVAGYRDSADGTIDRIGNEVA